MTANPYMGAYIIGIIVMLVSMYVSNRLKNRFKKYSKIRTSANLTGKEIAEKMLRDHQIHDVEVVSVRGQLTDHYNPKKKTINLSESVYGSNSVAAAAVSAHECGHAVQHAKEYSWLQFRSAIVPFVSISSRFMQWVILAGIILINTFPTLLLVGIILFAATTLFSFITLPVEFDASNRALAWLESERMTVGEEHDYAKDALKWAARTYVVAAIGSLATLLYYISVFTGRRN